MPTAFTLPMRSFRHNSPPTGPIGGEQKAARQAFMAEIIRFVAVVDLIDGDLVALEPVLCPSPATAIQTAQGQWKLFGHVGAVALSRTSDFEKEQFNHRHVLRRFGQVPDEYLKDNDDE
jgi:hypothetical protein